MKKTLIALAALGVVGAASAQVTVSGKYGFAYITERQTGAADKGGLATTDGNVTFAGSEDLGGGMTASASMDLRLRGRNTTAEGTSVGGRNAVISVSGDFGKVAMGAIEFGNGIVGRGTGGAAFMGLDDTGKTLDAASNSDYIQYLTPSLNGLVLKASLADNVGAIATGASTVSVTALGGDYDAGPISASLDYAAYKGSVDKAAVDGSCATGNTLSALTSATATCTGGTVVQAYAAQAYGTKSRMRLSASYNLGMAKVGFGWQKKNPRTDANGGNTQTVWGFSVPMGAMTVGYTAGTQKQTKTDGTVIKDNKGSEFGANYALSKRTEVMVSVRNEKTSGAETITTTRARLMHSF